jgi:hypothetical protein
MSARSNCPTERPEGKHAEYSAELHEEVSAEFTERFGPHHDRRTPRDFPSTLHLLVNAGADIDRKNNRNQTALDVANAKHYTIGTKVLSEIKISARKALRATKGKAGGGKEAAPLATEEEACAAADALLHELDKDESKGKSAGKKHKKKKKKASKPATSLVGLGRDDGRLLVSAEPTGSSSQ